MKRSDMMQIAVTQAVTAFGEATGPLSAFTIRLIIEARVFTDPACGLPEEEQPTEAAWTICVLPADWQDLTDAAKEADIRSAMIGLTEAGVFPPSVFDTEARTNFRCRGGRPLTLSPENFGRGVR